MTDDPNAFNAFEAAGWEQQAAGYDDFFGPITTRLVEPLLDAARVGPGTRVLDVATGPGYVADRAAARGAAVVGVDVADAMLDRARRAHPDLDFHRGDAEALPFPDGTFDAVLASFLLLHLGRPEQAAAEFARVLRPGGWVALTMWDQPDRARFIGVLVEAIAAAGARPPADIPPGPPIFRFSDEGELRGLLEGVGLDDVHVETEAFSLTVASPDALWRGLLGGTVRLSAMIRGQSDAMQAEIRAAFDRIVESSRQAETVALPVSVKLAAGAKPS